MRLRTPFTPVPWHQVRSKTTRSFSNSSTSFQTSTCHLQAYTTHTHHQLTTKAKCTFDDIHQTRGVDSTAILIHETLTDIFVGQKHVALVVFYFTFDISDDFDLVTTTSIEVSATHHDELGQTRSVLTFHINVTC